VHKATLYALCDIVLQCELCICLHSCSRHHMPSHIPLAPRRCLGLEGLVAQAASHRNCSTPTYSVLHRAYRWYIKFSIGMRLDDSSEHARSHATSSCISDKFCVADVDEEDTYLHLPYLQSCLHQRIQTLAKSSEGQGEKFPGGGEQRQESKHVSSRILAPLTSALEITHVPDLLRSNRYHFH
jgi:hypothetical protein